MTLPKLRKIVIRKFGEFDGEIKLKDCTLINCVYLSSHEFNEFSRILKFIFSANDIAVSLLSEDQEDAYVEIHIQTTQDDVTILRKSCLYRQIGYEINGIEAHPNEFIDKLKEYGCFSSYTPYLIPSTVQSIMNLTESARTELLESLCGNTELRMKYKQYKTKMNDLEVGMKFLNDSKKDFFSEKKAEKVRVENSKKIKQTEKLYEEQVEKMTLLMLYSTEKKIEAIPEKVQRLNDSLEALKIDYKEQRKKLGDGLSVKYKLDGEVFQSDHSCTRVNETLTKNKNMLLNHQNELRALTRHKEFNNIVMNEYDTLGKHLAEANKELQEYKDLHEKYDHTLDEYNQLNIGFQERHPSDYTMFNMIRKQIARMEAVKDELKAMEKTKSVLENEQEMHKDQLAKLTEIERNLQKNLDASHTKLYNLNKECIVTKSAVDQATKFIDRKLLQSRSVKESVKMIERKLVEKFPKNIVGVLSELFDVKTIDGFDVSKKNVINLLGRHATSIVVEDENILSEIENYLKMLFPEDDIILIPQQKLEAPDTLKRIRSSVTNVKCLSIEDFLKPISNEIRTILMSLLGTTVVCDTLYIDDIKKVFKSLGKSTRVASRDLQYVISPHNDRFQQSIESDNIIKVAQEMLDSKKKLLFLLSDLAHEKHVYEKYLKEMNQLKVLMKWNGQKLHRDEQCLQTLNHKIEKYKELIGQEQNEFFKKLKKNHELIVTKLQPLMNQHFGEFCKKYQLDSIREYQDIISELICFEHKHMQLIKSIETLTATRNSIGKVLSADVDWKIKEVELQAKIDTTTKIQVELTRKLEELRVQKTKNYKKWINHITQLMDIKKAHVEAKNKLKSNILSKLAESNDEKLWKKGMYELLTGIIMEYGKIELSHGSLMSLLNVPDADTVGENFDFLTHQLAEIEPDFDGLNPQIKESANINEIIEEMRYSARLLKERLDEYPLDLGSSEVELKRLTDKINDLSMEIKGTNIECQKVLSLLKPIMAERKKNFNECLQAINREIAKFCEIVFNGRIYAELMPMNEVEPYLDGIQYLWQAGAQNEYIHSGKVNWEAALALFLGILSYKRQRVLPYLEISSDLPILNALRKYSSHNDASLQSIVLWKTDINEGICDNCIMRFNDKIHFIDDEKLEQQLEDVLQ